MPAVTSFLPSSLLDHASPLLAAEGWSAFSMLVLVVVYGIPLAAAVWVHGDAAEHGRRALPWALATLLLGPFCAVVVLCYLVTHPSPPAALARFDLGHRRNRR